MKNLLILLYFCCNIFICNSQNYKANKGSIKALSGVNQYNVIFKYSDSLKVPNFGTEKIFLEKQVKKRESREAGSGIQFKKEWFENRSLFYEPAFVQGFNEFQLKKREVEVIENSYTTPYTMLIKTHLIYPGYDVYAWYEHTKLEITLVIFETSKPESILFSSKTIYAEGEGGDDDKTRISSAYHNLGRLISKFLHRKT